VRILKSDQTCITEAVTQGCITLSMRGLEPSQITRCNRSQWSRGIQGRVTSAAGRAYRLEPSWVTVGSATGKTLQCKVRSV